MKIESINGFRIGDKVRLKDGDGRPHTIKFFEIDGFKELFCVVHCEDGTEAMLHEISLLEPKGLDEAPKKEWLDEYNEKVDAEIGSSCYSEKGLDEAPKRRLRQTGWITKVKAEREHDEERLQENVAEIRRIRAEKDRLNGAAEEYSKTPFIDDSGTLHEEAVELNIYDAFKAGAKWMAEQGETVEGEIVCAVAHPHENKVIARVNGDYKFGDKVIVQIRKK